MKTRTKAIIGVLAGIIAIIIIVGLINSKMRNASSIPSFSLANTSETLAESVASEYSNGSESSSNLKVNPSDTEKNSITETTKNTSAIETNNQVEQNTEINRDAESDPINTNPADTPTTKPVELDNSNENSNSNSATPTPEPTATPIPEPTNTPIPEPTEIPAPQEPVAAIVQVTEIVYGSDDPDGDDNDVSVTVVRNYVVQPRESTEYHSYSVTDYYAYDAQADYNDLAQEFYNQYQNGLVVGYNTVGEEIIGFVD